MSDERAQRAVAEVRRAGLLRETTLELLAELEAAGVAAVPGCQAAVRICRCEKRCGGHRSEGRGPCPDCEKVVTTGGTSCPECTAKDAASRAARAAAAAERCRTEGHLADGGLLFWSMTLPASEPIRPLTIEDAAVGVATRAFHRCGRCGAEVPYPS